MSLIRKVRPYVVSTNPSSRVQRIRRRMAETKRHFRGAPHQVLYFHQVGEPYSDLAAQALSRFAAYYDVELVPVLVGPPPAADSPTWRNVWNPWARAEQARLKASRCPATMRSAPPRAGAMASP